MKYRNGKCYDDFGNEMSKSQINEMFRQSQEYIKQIQSKRNIKTEELSQDDIKEQLSQKFNVI